MHIHIPDASSHWPFYQLQQDHQGLDIIWMVDHSLHSRDTGIVGCVCVCVSVSSHNSLADMM